MTNDNSSKEGNAISSDARPVDVAKLTNHKPKKKRLLLIIVIIIVVISLTAGGIYLYFWVQSNDKEDVNKQLKGVSQTQIETKSQSDLETLSKSNGSSAKDLKSKALALYQLNKPQEAADVFKQLEQNYELDAGTYEDYGLVLISAGQKDLGLEKLEKSLSMMKASGTNQTDIDKLETKIYRIRNFG